MAIHAIGDVQGCHDELARLLDKLRFDPAVDRLWFTGDLVNRGPRSLEVLRLVKSLGEAAVVVLGNHDLHLLACALGGHRQPRDRGLRAVLDAADGGELLDWLRHRPLLHHHEALGTLLVHAGIAPAWSVAEALQCAGEAEQALRGGEHVAFLRGMYGNEPARWSASLEGMPRLRFIINCLTRMRYCSPDGRLDFADNGPPGSQAAGLVPWFEVPGRAAAATRIVFGHWSALELLHRPGLLGIDTGCVWGRTLTAARLDGPLEFASIPCHGCQPASGGPGT